MTKKYIAKHEGKIVGKRTTKSRTYTHALIVQRVEEIARTRAYGYTSTATDSSNFEYASMIALQQPGVTCRPRGWNLDTSFSVEEIERAKTEVAGGFDAYVVRLRLRAINGFETAKKTGAFEPFVATWTSRLDLAQKAVKTFTGPSTQFVAIVQTEEVK